MEDSSDHGLVSPIDTHSDLEEQPFLRKDRDDDDSAGATTPSPLRKHYSYRPFLVLLAIPTLLLLAVLVFNIGPATPDDHGSQSVVDTTADPRIIQYHETIPQTPALRDTDEYVLSSSWKVDEAPVTREYHWTVAAATLNPDGVYRPMLLINNRYPGPLIECNKGDTLLIHVNNQGPNATAIHFHGMFQNGTNDMDGTVGITQCPIAPNSTFTYRFTVQNDAGTYWYHAHHSAQASDGLVGPMIIHASEERSLQKLEYATDRILMVQDHYHNLTSELLMDYLAPDQENDEPVPDNALLNGRGVRDCADFESWPCDASNVSIPTMNLEAGQRHRLRVINVGAFAEFQVQFDEHAFYVTEVDGTDVQPEPFHRLNILPAQRYSVVIEANSTIKSSFWMRARMNTNCFATKNPRLSPELKAIIRYTAPGSKQTIDDPTTEEWPGDDELICRDLNITSLKPVLSISPPKANNVIVLRANFEIGAWRLARGFLNDSTWHSNATSPSLYRFIDATDGLKSLSTPLLANEQLFDREHELVLQTTGIRTVDLIINNFDDGAHPFHLHGHKFFVLVQGASGYPPATDELDNYLEQHQLLLNPLRRDTVSVESYGWAIIRVVLDNPGIWAFHCHNTWHAESGMLMQFLVRSEVVRTWHISQEQRDMCSREGVETGLRPSDDIWFGSFSR